MKYYVFRLKYGDNLKESLVDYCQKNNLKNVVIVSGVGSLYEVRLRKADGVSEYFEIRNYEITSLMGTIANFKPHIHIALSDNNLRTIGGHLLDGNKVNTTAEIVLANLDNYTLDRKYDESTGYDELEVVLNEN